MDTRTLVSRLRAIASLMEKDPPRDGGNIDGYWLSISEGGYMMSAISSDDRDEHGEPTHEDVLQGLLASITQAFRKEIAHASSGHDKHSEERVRTSLAVPTMGKGYSSLEEALEAVRKMASGDSVAIVDVTGGATEADKRKMN